DDRSAPQHGTNRGHRLVVHPDVQFVSGHYGDRAAARNHGLDRPPLRRTAADVIDELAEVETHRHFIVAGPQDVTRNAEELGSRRLLGSPLPVPFAAVIDDMDGGAERLDVVDRRRLPEGARNRREWRLHPGLAAATLE